MSVKSLTLLPQAVHHLNYRKNCKPEEATWPRAITRDGGNEAAEGN